MLAALAALLVLCTLAAAGKLAHYVFFPAGRPPSALGEVGAVLLRGPAVGDTRGVCVQGRGTGRLSLSRVVRRRTVRRAAGFWANAGT